MGSNTHSKGQIPNLQQASTVDIILTHYGENSNTAKRETKHNSGMTWLGVALNNFCSVVWISNVEMYSMQILN